ncbi:hypothetical protein D3C72_1522860 [compost metagenome]
MAARPPAPAPSATVFSSVASRATPFSKSASSQTKISSIRLSARAKGISPTALMAMPSAIVCPLHLAGSPRRRAVKDG